MIREKRMSKSTQLSITVMCVDEWDTLQPTVNGKTNSDRIHKTVKPPFPGL
jgi:hypothetical protein